jgi:hypothetical protein
MLLVMGAGFAASAAHVRHHHENRDERSGLTVDDLRGAYHGLRSESPLLRALQADHPAELDGAQAVADTDRQTLLAWLQSDRVSEDYDNLDLGDAAPAEIIAINCLSCHARQSSNELGGQVPLEYWDDVRAVAFSREISPTSAEIVVTSIHTHALSLAAIAIVLAGLLVATRWPRPLVSGLVLLSGCGLLLDIAGQWFTRDAEGLVWLIVVGGAAFALASGVALLVVVLDLWLPGPRTS